MLKSLLADEILLPRYMNWSADFRSLLFNEEAVQSCLKQMKRIKKNKNMKQKKTNKQNNKKKKNKNKGSKTKKEKNNNKK